MLQDTLLLSAHCAMNWAKKHCQLSSLTGTNKVGAIIITMQERCSGTERGLAQGRGELSLPETRTGVLSPCAIPQGRGEHRMARRWQLVLSHLRKTSPQPLVSCADTGVQTTPLEIFFFLSSRVISHILLHGLLLLTNRSTWIPRVDNAGKNMQTRLGDKTTTTTLFPGYNPGAGFMPWRWF